MQEEHAKEDKYWLGHATAALAGVAVLTVAWLQEPAPGAGSLPAALLLSAMLFTIGYGVAYTLIKGGRLLAAAFLATGNTEPRAQATPKINEKPLQDEPALPLERPVNAQDRARAATISSC